MKKIIILVLLAAVLVAGCATEESGKVGKVLPTVTDWEMNKVDIESPEGTQMLKGFYKYKNDEVFLMLTVVSGNSENIVNNEILAIAYGAVAEPTKSSDGFVGENIVKYIMDDEYYVIYTTSGKTGFVAVAETSDTINMFLSKAYGEFLFGEPTAAPTTSAIEEESPVADISEELTGNGEEVFM